MLHFIIGTYTEISYLRKLTDLTLKLNGDEIVNTQTKRLVDDLLVVIEGAPGAGKKNDVFERSLKKLLRKLQIRAAGRRRPRRPE